MAQAAAVEVSSVAVSVSVPGVFQQGVVEEVYVSRVFSVL
jgi:hypothetical protein